MPVLQKSTLATGHVRWLLVSLLWLVSVVAGLALVTKHDFAAGAVGPALPHGRSAIETVLKNSLPDTRNTPVYGCPIIPPSAVK